MPLPFPVVPVDISWSSALVGYCVRGLAARYPFISAGDIGKSVMGRPLWRLSLGAGENRVLYNASHHANEWICTPVLMKFAEELAEAYATGGTLFDQSAADILSYADIHLIPAVNPDGMDLVTGELQSGRVLPSGAEHRRGLSALSVPLGLESEHTRRRLKPPVPGGLGAGA